MVEPLQGAAGARHGNPGPDRAGALRDIEEDLRVARPVSKRLDGGSAVAEGRGAVEDLIHAFLPYFAVFKHLASGEQVGTLDHQIRYLI